MISFDEFLKQDEADKYNMLQECNAIIQQKENIIKEVREYINEYAWQEDIINGIWTTTGEPMKDRYMQLDWDNCNELLEILDKAN